MTGFSWNIVLAIAWTTLTGEFTPLNFGFGFLVGLLVLIGSRRILGIPRYGSRLAKVAGLVVYFIWELLLANLRVAWDVVTPRLRANPGIIGVPLDASTDFEILALATMITLTPGTLSLDVSTARRTLYVHVMYLGDGPDYREAFCRDIKNGFERRILEVTR